MATLKFIVIFVFLIVSITSCTRENIDPKYFCTEQSDCLTTTNTCECVTANFYVSEEGNRCENFGCDCINKICTKTIPFGNK